MGIRQRVFSASAATVSLLWLFLSMFGTAQAGAQGTLPSTAAPYPNFTNSLQTSVGDPGVIYDPAANVYLGGQTTVNGDFLIFQSPNLEDLFEPAGGANVYDMSQYADPAPHAGTQFTDPSSPKTPSAYNGFVDPRYPDSTVAGQTDHDCNWNSPTFVIWQGALYMTYEVRPKGAGSNGAACGGVSNAALLTANADAQAGHPDKNPGLVSSPILVMYNNDPSDPFCTRLHKGDTQLGNCWHAESYTLQNPFPGRAYAYLKRHTGDPNPTLWGMWENGGIQIMQLQDPGQPMLNAKTNPNNDPALAVTISRNVSECITSDCFDASGAFVGVPPYVSGYPYQQENFRTWEFRQTTAPHYNGPVPPNCTTSNYSGCKVAKGWPGGVNEGPQGFVTYDQQSNEHLFAVYSANSALQGDYLQGLLTFTGVDTGPPAEQDPLDGGTVDQTGAAFTGPVTTSNITLYSKLWTKSAQPVFQGLSAEPEPAPNQAYGYVDMNNPQPAIANDAVCDVGTLAFAESPGIPASGGNGPGRPELWVIYNGLADCVAGPTNMFQNTSLNNYSMNSLTGAPMDRSVHVEKVIVDAAGNPIFGPPPQNPGAPAGAASQIPGVPVGTPEPDGLLLTRPYGEVTSTPPLQMLVPATASETFGFDGSPQANAVFNVGGWDGGSGTPTVANDTTSNNFGGYLLITFQGSRIQLLGQTGPGTSCTAPAAGNKAASPSACGAVNIYVDGDNNTPHFANLATATQTTSSKGVFFDFTPGNNPHTGNQHTLKVMVAGPQTAGGPVLPVSVQSIVVFKSSGTATPAVLTVTPNNTSRAVGAANPPFTASYSGFVNGDTPAVLSGSPALSTTATASSPAGLYPVTAAQGTLSAANYTFAFDTGTLSVVQAPTVTITTSATLTAGESGYQAAVTVTNSGTGAASNVFLNSATLGAAAGSSLPQSVPALGPGASTVFMVTFPASAGAPGSGVSEKYAGTYTGGSFSASVRSATLP